MGNENRVIFRDEEDRRVFRCIALHHAERLQFRFLRIHFQPRGVMMLIGTEQPHRISDFESQVKGRYSFYLNQRLRAEAAGKRLAIPCRARATAGPVNWRPRFAAMPIEREQLETLARLGWDVSDAERYCNTLQTSLEVEADAVELPALECAAGLGEQWVPRPGEQLVGSTDVGEPPVRMPNSPNWWVYHAVQSRRQDEMRTVGEGQATGRASKSHGAPG
jgi:hypothetical protein